MNEIERLFSLNNKTALVTGANTGIGKAIAKGLGEAGATIIAANRNEKEGRQAVEEFVSQGLKAEFTLWM